MEKQKEKQIKIFLGKLSQENSKDKYPFTVICSKCGSSNTTIYHGCDYYNYSSYTQGFNENCGLKCKDCGNASEISSTE